MIEGEFNLDAPVASYTETWKRVILSPRQFFESLPKEGGLIRPLVFTEISAFLGGIVLVLMGGGLAGFFFLLLVAPLRLFVAAAFITLIARTLFDGQGDYEATFRPLGYASAVFIFVGIPVVKFFAALYGVALIILAISDAQSFDTVRATLTLFSIVITGWITIWALGLYPVALKASHLLW